MPSLGVELLSRKVADRLLVKDLFEAPEKFTDEEVGVIKSYHPTDIDFDTHGLPQEAFWYLVTDKIALYNCNIRFGKRYMDSAKAYSWYVYVEGNGPNGKFGTEETTTPTQLPLNIESGVTLLKKYLDMYQVTENEKVNLPNISTEDEKIKYKREVDNLLKIVTRAWNFLHEAGQEFKFNEIRDQIIELDRKFPSKASEIKKIEAKMAKVRTARIQFEDSYYQLKSEVAKFLK